jgi:hypothetical protein
MTLEPLQRTETGKLYIGKSEELLTGPMGAELYGKVQLIFTSPPFPLNEKKRYGNRQGEDYIKWFSAFAPLFANLLTPTGSIVIELGNAWEPGRPVQSFQSTSLSLRMIKALSLATLFISTMISSWF